MLRSSIFNYTEGWNFATKVCSKDSDQIFSYLLQFLRALSKYLFYRVFLQGRLWNRNRDAQYINIY